MIIGFSGLKGSGKNTAAEFVAEAYKGKYEIRMLSFAEKLKQSAAACFGVPKQDAVEWCDDLKQEDIYRISIQEYIVEEDTIKDREVISGREFLQNYGTEAHRDIFGANFWCDQLWNEMYPLSENWETHLFLITDVRFPNEAKYIHSEEGKIVEIIRPSVETGDTHASEKPLPEELIDIRVMNDGSLSDLQELIEDNVYNWLS